MKPTYEQLRVFIEDLINEPFRIETEDEREKTLYEARELLAGRMEE